jgi:hypothetical protein
MHALHKNYYRLIARYLFTIVFPGAPTVVHNRAGYGNKWCWMLVNAERF